MLCQEQFQMQQKANVINKKIVYSDIILPVKDLGNNLKVSTIWDASEHSLESSLEKDNSEKYSTN